MPLTLDRVPATDVTRASSALDDALAYLSSLLRGKGFPAAQAPVWGAPPQADITLSVSLDLTAADPEPPKAAVILEGLLNAFMYSVTSSGGSGGAAGSSSVVAALLPQGVTLVAGDPATSSDPDGGGGGGGVGGGGAALVFAPPPPAAPPRPPLPPLSALPLGGCLANPCASPGGACRDRSPVETLQSADGLSYACSCLPGWAGDGRACRDVDECALGTAQCDPLASCVNRPGGYDCGPCPVRRPPPPA